ELGKKVLKMERDFNARAGFTAEHDRLPDYFMKEALPPHNITFQVKDEELDQMFKWWDTHRSWHQRGEPAGPPRFHEG
ncbi:MAG: hypothetical protein JW736_05805, partial [Deltaproteobacteria bacterium]|nr:hypothetical protein [Deltaproteobacteria bacterium]